MTRFASLPIIGLLIAIAGCPTNSSTSKEKIYEVKGKVMAIKADPKDPKVQLDHEAVPGVMEAMEMWFHVDNVKLVEGLTKGDQVRGKFKDSDGKYVITEWTK